MVVTRIGFDRFEEQIAKIGKFPNRAATPSTAAETGHSESVGSICSAGIFMQRLHHQGRAMRKSAITFMLASALFVCGHANAAQAKHLPPGTIQQGSMANHQLTQDTLSAVVTKVSELGCQQFESYTAYMVAMPKGPKGARVWREKWIFTCQGADIPIDIRFTEVGPNAAYEIL
jgi:hypothetical protein